MESVLPGGRCDNGATKDSHCSFYEEMRWFIGTKESSGCVFFMGAQKGMKCPWVSFIA